VEAKKTELDQFAGRLGDDLSAEVMQQTLAVKVEIHELAGFTGFYKPEVKLRTYYGMASVRPSVRPSVRLSVRPLATSCPLNILKSL